MRLRAEAPSAANTDSECSHDYCDEEVCELHVAYHAFFMWRSNTPSFFPSTSTSIPGVTSTTSSRRRLGHSAPESAGKPAPSLHLSLPLPASPNLQLPVIPVVEKQPEQFQQGDDGKQDQREIKPGVSKREVWLYKMVKSILVRRSDLVCLLLLHTFERV